VKRLELNNNDLRLEKQRLQGQFDELEHTFKTECQTIQNLTTNLEREAEGRLQLEAELRALKLKLQRKGWLGVYFNAVALGSCEKIYKHRVFTQTYFYSFVLSFSRLFWKKPKIFSHKLIWGVKELCAEDRRCATNSY
jgi:hypothetical protein